MKEYLTRLRESTRIFLDKVRYGTYFPSDKPVCNISPETQRWNETCLEYSNSPEGKRASLGIREDDITMQLRVFGTLPPVRTMKLQGSKCEVLEWLDTPRP